MAWIQDSSRYLSYAERDNNAMEVLAFFRAKNWDILSISALAGNMDKESTLNPVIVNARTGAYGLTQWLTNKTKMQNWCTTNYGTYADGNAQCNYIYWEQNNPGPTGADQWYATSDYPLTMAQFAVNALNYNIDQLTLAFKYCYERNRDEDGAERIRKAVHYYELFTGGGGGSGLIKKLFGFMRAKWFLPFNKFTGGWTN